MENKLVCFSSGPDYEFGTVIQVDQVKELASLIKQLFEKELFINVSLYYHFLIFQQNTYTVLASVLEEIKTEVLGRGTSITSIRGMVYIFLILLLFNIIISKYYNRVCKL